MKLHGIDHVSINTRDFAASARFYTEVMGFRRLQTVPMGGDAPGDRFTITYFEIPGGGRMELSDYGGAVPRSQRCNTRVLRKALTIQER
jgi:catechol 2,3-dioxygenase-like lactoylglutathione lyase family enzyme